MSDTTIELYREPLRLKMAAPGTYYRGTRFDWTGVFRSIYVGGTDMAGPWFDGCDPYRHDNVCGPSEEFLPIWIDDTHCVKIGVGLLEVPEGRDKYDRFRLYDVRDSGNFHVETGNDRVVFVHQLRDMYEYRKTVSLTNCRTFKISHSILWMAGIPMVSTCYNHNFFTMGLNSVDESRHISFKGKPEGNWREDSVNCRIEGNGLKFERAMRNGEICFMDNLTVSGEPAYCFSILDGSKAVHVEGDVPMDHAVVWANSRVACLEPYVNISLSKGKQFDWSITYKLDI